MGPMTPTQVELFGEAPDAPPVIPLTGEPFPLQMAYADGYAFGETFADLVGVLIDGYDMVYRVESLVGDEGVPQDEAYRQAAREQIVARVSYAVTRAMSLQAEVNLSMMEDWQQLDDSARAVLGGDRTRQPDIAEWSAPVPLVLSAHDYEPYGDLAVPDGNIVWLNPFTGPAAHRLARRGGCRQRRGEGSRPRLTDAGLARLVT